MLFYILNSSKEIGGAKMYEVKPYMGIYAIYKNDVFVVGMYKEQYATEVCDMLNYDNNRHLQLISENK